ncbi:sigma-54-dependent Fis family transcriptional regulator [Celeribacter sp. HF31]|uniref:sigma-54-dependent Fis family transcriptional regulator n=1 Tax=Celeribacter sp. HF31 TaxID=2721558 RepID=UPI00142F84B2|nr:sigma-54-dependent Fis family transcriptional regulator [Celeribacter sp. HF31]NIY81329.1 sigma-54-dependent Fis family transcriptional regulator [Celeribacter sp. HF31]
MPATALRQRFSHPENDRQVQSTWEKFLSGQDSGSDAVRRLIDDSWRRCHGAVDPGRDGAPPPAQGDALYDLLTDSEELVRASSSIIASARDFLFETGTVMVLTDASGVVLSVEGDNALRDGTEAIHLMPGANWSEETCGTNAIGTAIEIGQPIQIHSSEHYCSGIQRWSCSASVIRDPASGGIVGALDISGLSESYSRHSLSLAITAAGRIENRLAQREMNLRYRLLDHCLDRLQKADRDGIIVFDRSGTPIKTNERAAAVMTEWAKSHGLRDLVLRDVTLPWRNGRISPENLPQWVDRDWIEPIEIDGERLGSVLVLPDRSAVVRRTPKRETAPVGVAGTTDAFARLSGSAPAYLEALRRASLLAKSPAPVLLLGETGVGKDAFAQALHESGPQAQGPFVAVNCGGFSRELLTSELFGYAEGAFTGARRGGMKGKIEAADGGTLFLDEIGEMPLDLQPHLLRVLESGEVYRLGENTPRKVKLRLISATNRDLKSDSAEGRFRMDLFYRIAVTSLRLPALRERLTDLPGLSEHLLTQIAKRYEMAVPVIEPGLYDRFADHDWPGNIRELRNVLEGMVLESGGAALGVEHLPMDWSVMTRDGASDPEGLTPLQQAERAAIVAAIERHRGNLTSVARDLGIAKSTLYLRLDKLGLKEALERMRQ